jgi:undecaprenyl phosphate N,N'-diacetylbacillosamine 1-phosphate transferase
MYKNVIKRVIDVTFSAFILILISPLFILISILLAIYYRGNPFFTQKRPGLNEKTFLLLKFKSMVEKFDEEGHLLPDAQRITPVGKFIRKTSIDEMPQLLNILRGEMSFIGPRPLLMSYLPYYTKREKTRHSVRPGLTGLAQVSGRNNLKLPERLEMDVQYVEKLSFVNDLRIVLKTVGHLLRAKDITVVASSKTLKDYRDEEQFKS